MNGYRPRRARVRACALGLLVALLGALAPAARAQQFTLGNDGTARPIRAPIFTLRTFKSCADMLGLAGAQRRDARALFDRYQDDHAAALERFEEVSADIVLESENAGANQDLAAPILKACVKFMVRAEQLNAEFTAGLKALLDERQLPLWDRAERLVRRRHFQLYANAADQRLDLIEILDGLAIGPPPAELKAALDQYETELDAILRDLFVQVDRGLVESASAADRGPLDDEVEKIASECRRRAMNVARLNRRTAPLLTPLIPELHRQKYEIEINRALYRAVYRPSPAERTLDAAERLADLGAAQRESLQAIRRAHNQEAGPINQRWVAVLAEVQAEPFLGGSLPNPQQTKRIEEAKAARQALDDHTIAEVKKILNEEQRKRLPRPRSRPELDFGE